MLIFKFNFMKRIYFTLTYTFLLVMCLFTSCKKDEIRAVLATDIKPSVVTASSSNIVLDSANAQNTIALLLSWTPVQFGVNIPSTSVLEIDSLKGDFSKAQVMNVLPGITTRGFSKKELNDLSIGLGLVPGSKGEIKVRMKTTYAANEPAIYSSPLVISVTPYATLVLKYAMPSELFVQGDAVASNWGYPIADDQKFSKIDDTKLGLIVYLQGGKKLAFITSSTGWSDPAYKAATWSEPQTGGNFVPSGSQTQPAWGGSDITAPAASGFYQIIVDFQSGTYKISAVPGLLTAPSSVYIVGDATPLQWNAPDNSQQFQKLSDHVFQLTITLAGGKNYALITAASNWTDPAYILPANSNADNFTEGGTIIASGAANNWAGVNMKSPVNSGTYKIRVNFKAGYFTVVK